MKELNPAFIHGIQKSSKTWRRNGLQAILAKSKRAKETASRLRRFLPSDEDAKIILTDNSLEFFKALEDLMRNHDRLTSLRAERNGIAELGVRGEKEGISALTEQSCLHESWRGEAVESSYYLGNIQVL